VVAVYLESAKGDRGYSGAGLVVLSALKRETLK